MEVKELIKLMNCLANDESEPKKHGKVIVRSYNAGVLFGDYVSNDGDTVVLSNAVQMWRWKAAKGGTLIDCAELGVDPDGCKFSEASASVTVFNVCAIIDCSDCGAKSLATVCGGSWS